MLQAKFFTANIEIKKKIVKGLRPHEDLFLYRRIFVKSVFVRTIFDCIFLFRRHFLLYSRPPFPWLPAQPLNILCIHISEWPFSYPPLPHLFAARWVVVVFRTSLWKCHEAMESSYAVSSWAIVHHGGWAIDYPIKTTTLTKTFMTTSRANQEECPKAWLSWATAYQGSMGGRRW